MANRIEIPSELGWRLKYLEAEARVAEASAFAARQRLQAVFVEAAKSLGVDPARSYAISDDATALVERE